jgi:hypothetical protein
MLTTGLKLENVTLSELSQTQKDKSCVIPFTRVGTFIDSESRSEVTKGKGEMAVVSCYFNRDRICIGD